MILCQIDLGEVDREIERRKGRATDADAAFRQSTAKVVNHAESLLASLVDKKEELEV
jgi:hypothetical protein